jgi:DNA-directed RNA polymerase subunit N (RpoN/RPB10)
MKVNCLSCGHAVDLRDAYDDYDGQVKCFACGAILSIRTREGQVKWVELAGGPGNTRPAFDSSLQHNP